MIETVYLDTYRMMRIGREAFTRELQEALEAATCRLMLKMWAEGLYTADGWTIMRVEQRTSIEKPEIINLRPYNQRTKRFYIQQGADHGTQR